MTTHRAPLPPSVLALAVTATLALAAPASATERAMSAAELAHALDRVATTARVLYVAAHPDDENTRLLAWLANVRHVEVAYLSMTRGGGGQNLIGPERGQLLDVIRTEELLAARRLDGARQRFTRMRDFGYSKRADETLAIWGKEEALADVVWAIRSFQPDVIVTRFGESPPNHGHHTASAILAREAFVAAADPARFPEQLARGVRPWQATRVVHNVPSWPGAPAPPKGAIEIDVGAYDPRLGLGMGELAARSRSQHKSQGFGVMGERGKLVERFVFVAGKPLTADLLEGVELGWRRLGPKAASVTRVLAIARRTLERDRPERALPALLRALDTLEALPDEPRVVDARRDLTAIVVAAAGVYVRANAATPVGVPGAKVDVAVEVVARTPARVALGKVTLPGAPPAPPAGRLATNERRLVPLAVTLPPDAPPSVPIFLAEPPLPGRYVVADPRLVGEPRTPPALVATVELTVEGRAVVVQAPVVHAFTDPVHGERERAFVIAPPATVTPTREAVLFPNGRPARVHLRVRAAGPVRGEVELGLPAGWQAAPARGAVELAGAGDETTLVFTVTPPRGAGSVTIAPALVTGGRRYALREDVIDHPHIPLQLVLAPAALRLVPLALRVPRGRVGYIRGSGDSVAEDLAHVGVRIEELSDEALRSGDLSRYAAIVVGIRAYNTRPSVRAAHARLMDYVAAGGTVVVQYNTNNRLAPLTEPIGPYPFEIGRGRITDETATMTPVDPRDPLLCTPHALAAADFAGWVQERGIYFASTWDERYRPLFAIADPGEAPLEGSTLVARHGKGRYVYTGLAFFRQLPAGVPGAYRLLLNLIAAPPTRATGGPPPPATRGGKPAPRGGKPAPAAGSPRPTPAPRGTSPAR